MAAAIRGLGDEETHHLTLAMTRSGECWDLAAEIPTLVDKHSTGGVGDKVSLVLAPLLAAAGLPIVMLTGRALGHTGGTADKLEVIAGLDLNLDRRRALQLLGEVGMAIGVATDQIAPADRRLYQLRHETATVESLPLITASILSKKLATGAGAIVFDVKTGSGAFMATQRSAEELAAMLVRTSRAAGMPASALITDMSQPLGDWVGHAVEVNEALDCLGGEGPDEVMNVVYALAEELAVLAGSDRQRQDFVREIESGKARVVFERWVEAQGASPKWLAAESLIPAPCEMVVRAGREGVLAGVATRRLGQLVAEASRHGARDSATRLDAAVALRYRTRLGRELSQGDALASLFLRQPDERLLTEISLCFEIGDKGSRPPLVINKIGGG
jgi:pyrimidine-nucleoside phosphorylase